MSSTIVDGTTYTVPDDGARGWGIQVTNLLVALGNNSLLIKGGSIPLTSDANFGANFGLISAYFTSRTANAASAGALRLANADFIRWRNGANSANLSLGIAADKLQFEGIDLATISTTQTLTNKTIDASANTITNLTVAMLAAGVLITSTSLAGASNTNVPSTLAVKTYIDTSAALQVPQTRTLTAGAGLSGGGDLTTDRTFDVNVDNSTIEINADTLRVKDAGIVLAKLASNSVDENKIVSTTYSSTGGLVGGSGTKVSVQVDNSTIELNTNALRVKDLGITTAKIAASNVTSAKLENNIVFPGTGSVTIPAGTTAQRSGSPANGMIRYNSDLTAFEGYNSGWGPLASGGGSAGSLTTDLSSGNLTVSAGTTLTYPFLTIQAADTYTINGQMVSAGRLTVSGTLIINGTVVVGP